MKRDCTLVILITVCVLAIVITQTPLTGMVSGLLPSLVILVSALVIFRRKLSVGSVILAVILSLVALPLAIYILVSVGGMLLVNIVPLWLNGVLSYILQAAVSLLVFALVCRILHRRRIRGIRGIHVLIAGALALASAILDGVSYGFVSEVPDASIMDMLDYLTSQNPILALLSQIAFYGALFFMGYVMWRNVHDENTKT